jgi:hypothetical protein
MVFECRVSKLLRISMCRVAAKAADDSGACEAACEIGRLLLGVWTILPDSHTRQFKYRDCLGVA